MKGSSMKFVGYLFVALIVLIFLGNCQSIAASVVSADMLSSSAVVDTPNFSIPFTIIQNGKQSYGITFGIAPGATRNIDPAVGELDYPPLPPGGGYSCFLTSDYFSTQILDLRGYTGPAQSDDYIVKIAMDKSDTTLFPITFTWPNLNSYYSGPVRLKFIANNASFDIDMKAQTSYTKSTFPGDPAKWPDFGSWTLHIIAEGPRLIESIPIVLTYGITSGAFQAIVNTPRPVLGYSVLTAATSAWFEYGSTKSYGSTTTGQAIADGTSGNISAPFDVNSMPMDSRIHFRAVVQNSTGTYYGEDRIVSRGNPAPEDTSGNVKYRTAAYRDWSDAVDQKDKRKSIKPKPDKVDFCFYVVTDSPRTHGMDITFSASVHLDSMSGVPQSQYSGWSSDIPGKHWFSGWGDGYSPGLAAGETVYIYGIGLKGKKQTLSSYRWHVTDPQKGIYSQKKKRDAIFVQNDLQLPMPNLHNVGENIFGGVSQTPVQLIVGANSGAHSILLKKYSNVLKSLIKEKKGGNIYHDQPARCLNMFDTNHKEILKQQTNLPPDKHNNSLFAEQLVLKLNIAASDSGIFPPGFGDLLYSNSTSFDGQTVRQIAHNVDSFLTCPALPPNGVSDASVYYNIVHELNTSFSGPMDTTSWSGSKVFCTGVRMLSEVPYLQYNPSAITQLNYAKENDGAYVQQLSTFTLSQNYPNPFNPTTTIEFSLAEQSLVTLKVYNLLGQEIRTLLNREEMDDGDQAVEFDATGLPSGVYFYKITTQSLGESSQEFQAFKKMLLLK
jgi:hypothetical protein